MAQGSCIYLGSGNYSREETIRGNTVYFNLFSRQLKVRIRFTDLKKGNFEDDYNVAQFISHPKFDKKRLSDNIGVMFLEKPLDLIREDGINAACLPACNNMFDHTFVNHTGKF